MRADYVVALVAAHYAGDDAKVDSLVNCMIADANKANKKMVATRLQAALNRRRPASPIPLAPLTTSRGPAVQGGPLHQKTAARTLDSLELPHLVKTACRELIEEQQRTEILLTNDLTPRNRIILSGPPGNGKTCLAEALACELSIPFYTVGYESLVGSFLGETGARLHQLFESVKASPCVLFFDEFDTVGKERGDKHETGEIKRVVSTLLLHMDKVPSHVVFVAATNHGELLDRAAWRRFQLRLNMPAPTWSQKIAWLTKLQVDLGKPLGLTPADIAAKLPATSFSDLEEFSRDVRRRRLLSGSTAELGSIVLSVLEHWQDRVPATRKEVQAVAECAA